MLFFRALGRRKPPEGPGDQNIPGRSPRPLPPKTEYHGPEEPSQVLLEGGRVFGAGAGTISDVFGGGVERPLSG